MRCYACHQPVGANARFCSACGASLPIVNPAQVQHVQPAQAARPLPRGVELAYAPADEAYPTYGAPAAPAPLSYAPQQLAPRMAAGPFVPAPARFDEPGANTPFGYAAPAGAPFGYAAPVQAPAPLGYGAAPAPAPAPSMVNNVMVTQVTPPAPTPTLVVDGRNGGAGVLVRALFFLLTGGVLGALWVGAAFSGRSAEAWALLFVAAATVAVLLLDIAILNRYPHR